VTPSLRRIAPAAMPTILTEPPSLPTLRPETRRLCGAAEVAVFSETGEFTGLRQDYHSLQAPATPEEAAAVAADLAETRALLIPADRSWLLSRILTLLSHYRQDALPPALEAAVAEDWAEDLDEFPAWAIAEATRTWRRTRKFKPTIAEMRQLCSDLVAPHVRLVGKLQTTLAKGPHPATSPDSLAAITGRIARSFRRVPE
jgi:hypothetical protein